MHRRTFLAASSIVFASSTIRVDVKPRVISCQVYPWLTFKKREGHEFGKAWGQDLARVKRAGGMRASADTRWGIARWGA